MEVSQQIIACRVAAVIHYPPPSEYPRFSLLRMPGFHLTDIQENPSVVSGATGEAAETPPNSLMMGLYGVTSGKSI